MPLVIWRRQPGKIEDELLKNTLFRIMRFFYTYLVLLKQLLTIQFSKSPKPTKTAMILIAKKYAYLHMAIICMSSFLYYNRDFQIQIYCDRKILKILRIFLPFFRTFSVTVLATVPNEADPYIEQLKLFFKLNCSSTILIDVDIRWQGVLAYDFKNPLAYNHESNKEALDFWPVLAVHLGVPTESHYQVLTCCVTSWGDEFVEVSPVEIEEIIAKLDSFQWNDHKINDFKRLRGQFVMSYIFSKLSNKTVSIVELEKSNGKILETSFFGATGYRYGT